MNRQNLLCLALTGAALLATWPVLAAPPACTPDPDLTLFESFRKVINPDFAEEAKAAQAEAQAKADDGEALTNLRNAAAASSTGAPESFADRVQDSLADFLPLAQFAVTGLDSSDDGKSVTAKLRMFELFGGKTAITVTAVEPVLYSKLEEEIVQSARESVSKDLVKKAGDFADLRGDLTWALRRTAGNWQTTRSLFGRETETYGTLVDQLVRDSIRGLPEQLRTLTFPVAEEVAEKGQKLETLLGLEQDDATATKLSELQEKVEAEPTEALPATQKEKKAALQDLEATLCRFQTAFLQAHENLNLPDFDALPSLISNQPELLVKGAYRQPDRVVGPPEWGATMSFEQGFYNFNRVLRQYRTKLRQEPTAPNPPTEERMAELRREAYDSVTTEAGAQALMKQENRMVYKLSYRKVRDYDETFSYKAQVVGDDGTPSDVSQTAMLNLPGFEELKLQVDYSRPVRSLFGGPAANLAGMAGVNDKAKVQEKLAEQPLSRIDLSVEGNWTRQEKTSGTPLKLAANRLIARLTFTQPLSGGLSLPVSITYANRNDLLKPEDGDQFSAHVAISYKFMRPSDVLPAAK